MKFFSVTKKAHSKRIIGNATKNPSPTNASQRYSVLNSNRFFESNRSGSSVEEDSIMMGSHDFYVDKVGPQLETEPLS